MWAGYTIDKTSYLDHQVQELKSDLTEIQKYEDELQAQQVLDLSNYSDRVIGIGEAQKLNSEFIQRDSGESEWLPQHLMELEEQLQDRLSNEAIEMLEQRIKQAEQEGKDQVLIPNANTEVSLDDAKKLFNSLSDSNRKESIETLEEPTVNLQKKRKIPYSLRITLIKLSLLNNEQINWFLMRRTIFQLDCLQVSEVRNLV